MARQRELVGIWSEMMDNGQIVADPIVEHINKSLSANTICDRQ